MKTYKITFTFDYVDYEITAATKEIEYYREKIKEYSRDLIMCKKYKGKTIKLEDIPDLIKETGYSVVLSEDECEIYNGCRE